MSLPLNDFRLPQRFWDKVRVDVDTGCWEWRGALTTGYGQFRLDGKTRMAHRVAVQASGRPILPGTQVDHLCRNRACVNPGHLEVVTPSVNMTRSANGYALRGWICSSGHDVREAGLRADPRHPVASECRQCAHDRASAKASAISAACRRLGLTHREYISRHGQSRAVAEAIAGGGAE